jgi:hypothetical protein
MTAIQQPIPAYAEVAVGDAPWCLDVAEHYFGKDVDEATRMFEHGTSMNLIHDLFWMSPVAFRYYVQAAVRYCLSDKSTDDPDAINCIAGTLRLWLNSDPDVIGPSADYLANFCDEIVSDFDRFGASPDIYVDLKQDYCRLAAAIRSTKPTI